MYPKRIGSVSPPRLVAAGALLGCGLLAASAAPHPFRVSVADAVIAGEVLEVRIRFFWDDLEFALMESTSDMEFRLQETDEVDARIERYIGEHLTLRAGDAVLDGALVERGVQGARRPDEVMWWYRLEYPLAAGVEELEVTNRLLFNMFEDQRNLLNLTTRSGRERSHFFSWDDDTVTLPVN